MAYFLRTYSVEDLGTRLRSYRLYYWMLVAALPLGIVIACLSVIVPGMGYRSTIASMMTLPLGVFIVILSAYLMPHVKGLASAWKILEAFRDSADQVEVFFPARIALRLSNALSEAVITYHARINESDVGRYTVVFTPSGGVNGSGAFAQGDLVVSRATGAVGSWLSQHVNRFEPIPPLRYVEINDQSSGTVEVGLEHTRRSNLGDFALCVPLLLEMLETTGTGKREQAPEKEILATPGWKHPSPSRRFASALIDFVVWATVLIVTFFVVDKVGHFVFALPTARYDGMAMFAVGVAVLCANLYLAIANGAGRSVGKAILGLRLVALVGPHPLRPGLDRGLVRSALQAGPSMGAIMLLTGGHDAFAGTTIVRVADTMAWRRWQDASANPPRIATWKIALAVVLHLFFAMLYMLFANA